MAGSTALEMSACRSISGTEDSPLAKAENRVQQHVEVAVATRDPRTQRQRYVIIQLHAPMPIIHVHGRVLAAGSGYWHTVRASE